MKNFPPALRMVGVVGAIALTDCGGSQTDFTKKPDVSFFPDICEGIPDITNSDPDCKAIQDVTRNNILLLEEDGKFHPENKIDRATTAEAVLKKFGKFHNSQDYCNGQDPFPDVKALTEEGTVAKVGQVVCAGVQEKMITGYKGPPAPGHFGPEDITNRAQFVTMVCRLLGNDCTSQDTYSSYTDVPTQTWFTAGANLNAKQNLLPDPFIKISNKFQPETSVTKRDAAHAFRRLNIE